MMQQPLHIPSHTQHDTQNQICNFGQGTQATARRTSLLASHQIQYTTERLCNEHKTINTIMGKRLFLCILSNVYIVGVEL